VGDVVGDSVGLRVGEYVGDAVGKNSIPLHVAMPHFFLVDVLSG